MNRGGECCESCGCDDYLFTLFCASWWMVAWAMTEIDERSNARRDDEDWIARIERAAGA